MQHDWLATNARTDWMVVKECCHLLTVTPHHVLHLKIDFQLCPFNENKTFLLSEQRPKCYIPISIEKNRRQIPILETVTDCLLLWNDLLSSYFETTHYLPVEEAAWRGVFPITCDFSMFSPTLLQGFVALPALFKTSPLAQVTLAALSVRHPPAVVPLSHHRHQHPRP